MAQKIYPRSLRSSNQCASDFSFYSDSSYASLWKKTVKISTELLNFCEKNLLYKKNSKNLKKKKNKNYKYKTFYNTRSSFSHLKNGYQISPILLKFYKQSLSYKYNPIKAIFKPRRSKILLKKKSFKQQNVKLSLLKIFFSFFLTCPWVCVGVQAPWKDG